MSIQSTITLTREEAEARLVYKLQEERKKFIEAEVHVLTNEQLEDALDETYHNYLITEDSL